MCIYQGQCITFLPLSLAPSPMGRGARFRFHHSTPYRVTIFGRYRRANTHTDTKESVPFEIAHDEIAAHRVYGSRLTQLDALGALPAPKQRWPPHAALRNQIRRKSRFYGAMLPACESQNFMPGFHYDRGIEGKRQRVLRHSVHQAAYTDMGKTYFFLFPNYRIKRALRNDGLGGCILFTRMLRSAVVKANVQRLTNPPG